MSNIIQGVKVNGTVYKYDYESLENLPEPELPAADSAVDVGKVLTVDDSGLPSWEIPPSGLPTSTTYDEGKVLTVNDSGLPSWETPPSGLPSSSGSDSGKALIVNNTGNPVWDSVFPPISSQDAGKALVLTSTGPTWGSALPTPPNNSYGYALAVSSSEGQVSWMELIPVATTHEIGKSLVVNGSGHVVWGNASGILPTIGSQDAGKALVVNHSNSSVWKELVPPSDDNDSGKVLRVNSTGNPAWSDISRVLNVDVLYGTDQGRALVVNSTGEPVWREILPTHDTSYDGSDAGKALIVATNGELKWDEAGGGGSLPDASGASDGDVLILMVGDCGHTNLGWGSPFPSYDSYDVGKVLSINAMGELIWADPSDLPGTDSDLPTDRT